ncbi:alpha/beta hydrolase [Jiangella rhizosphaerae]|uniref:Alpha/beta hydrolase n=1 Tax=Jiangella rhizosphaerae TaxID=2293569 RepID=A0A418KVJ3_9ACTN|nr:dienelactone hydrolase family protein [Jiangella rhizosphaerae]RIQ34826.1 alpha/beta hydrolase [Jiangella rhizosphaerae]
MAEPAYVLTEERPRGDVRAAVLLLHGGRSESREPVRRRQPSVLRLIPFATRLRRSGGPLGLTVWRLRYTIRGWNGADESRLADVRSALAAVRSRDPDVPVALVGYSMGGRAAIRVAGEPAAAGVVAVAGLAPWLTPSEPPELLGGKHVLLMHGTADTTTDPRATAALAARLDGVAASCRYVPVAGDGHAMLRHPSAWHREVTRFVLTRTGLAAPDQPR